MDLGKEILKAIQIMIDKKLDNYKVDITYQSIIKNITQKGYVVLDRSGQERTVQCCIPGVELRPMQSVYVKEPMGRLNDIHICGVIGNTGNPNRRNRRRWPKRNINETINKADVNLTPQKCGVKFHVLIIWWMIKNWILVWF